MARKSPPVKAQVVAPLLPSNAFLKGRLIDFDTGSAALEAQHMAWLRMQMATAKTNSMYRIRLVGYASKKGSSDSNMSLSYNRANAVLKYMVSLHAPANDRVETFRSNGEEAYVAPESDDDALWRAVEVHIFIGDIPPPPSKWIPIPRKEAPLPGGERFTDWEIASPGGVIVTAVVGGGFNVFFIRNVKLNELRGYIQPVGGVGGSLSIPGLKPIFNAIQQIVTGVSGSPPDFTAVKTSLPVTWDEMEDCLVRVSQAGAGAVRGYALAVITFTAAGVWQRSAQGNPVKLPGGVLFQFQTQGANWALGLGASMALGPLVRIPG
ncbi:MAG: OmpA family protein [Burkholderiales bacterium]|nr:OmpA family protein [Burkholderiales bacterium]